MSQFSDAIEAYRLAERVSDRLCDQTSILQALTGAGVCFFYSRDIARLAEQGKRTWQAAEAQQSDLGRACARTLLALDGFCRGDLETMRSHPERAAPVLENSPFDLTSVLATGFRAFPHTLQSEYELSEPLFAAALERARAAGLAAEVIRIHWQRGIALANRGLFRQALAALQEGWHPAELNQEAYWIARFPNTIAWVHQEMGDEESALELNEQGITLARKVSFGKAEANSRINLALLLCRLDEPERAAEHLDEGERILNWKDEKIWLRWRFNLRLRSAQGAYWLARGDLAAARTAAQLSLQSAESVSARKYMALAHGLRGDIARVSGDPVLALRSYLSGLEILERFPCPLVEWKLLAAAATCRPSDDRAAAWSLRSKQIVNWLARNVPESVSAEHFLSSAKARFGVI